MGASPITDGLASTDIAYDAHGNTVTLADQSITYDVADQHLSTTVDGETVTYTRDVTGSIVARASTDDPFASLRYTAGAVLDGSNVTLQRTLSLPGGVNVSFEADSSQKWNYANLHGDSIIQTDGAGLRVGTRAIYDPFGQPIDPVTGDIGTEDADDAVADTTPGEADNAWVGGHRKLYEHQGSIATKIWARRSRGCTLCSVGAAWDSRVRVPLAPRGGYLVPDWQRSRHGRRLPECLGVPCGCLWWL